MSFRENLREAIDYSGLEQKEVANKANISLRNIENYLRENASIPVADKAVKIAQVLGVTVEYLVTGQPPVEIAVTINPDIQKLIHNINKLPKNKQRIVTQNALNLAEILLQPSK
ncbi:MAG: helix-turn-helix domain-containing protein [Treponema sp.]|jgi:transcriptional regulator with XRE-family HTH domain|nr:helix-turn-helix domain-containing protein [Treponema sp.]